MIDILITIGIAIIALLGAPLFTIISGVTLITHYFAQVGQTIPTEPTVIIDQIYRIAETPELIAIPVYAFAGYMLAESKSPKRLVALAMAIFGWAPGGLAIVALATSAFFTAFTGASGITIVALGGLLYPVLIEHKYPERFSLGLVTTSGSLGLLFPPSLPIILYGVIAGVSINQLFVAGIIPGLLLLVLLSAYAMWMGIKIKIARENFSFGNLIKAIKGAAWEIPLPFIIVGGIYGGIFTATEAAAITAMYVFIIEVVIYRDLKITTDIPAIMKESMLLVGAILMIIGAAFGLSNFLIDQQVPDKLFAVVQEAISSRIVFLIILNLFLLVVGMMMDIFSAILVVVPLLVPFTLPSADTKFLIDPIHLGIIFLMNLEIGYLTPPVGLNLFLSSLRFRKPVLEVARASLVYIGILLIGLLLTTYIPEISTLLVQLTGAK